MLYWAQGACLKCKSEAAGADGFVHEDNSRNGKFSGQLQVTKKMSGVQVKSSNATLTHDSQVQTWTVLNKNRSEGAQTD
jgi:hypothetical protein